MPGVPQTLPVPPLVNEMTMLNAIRLAAGSGGGTGDVTGPASSIAGNVAVFAGATGKLLADGGVGAFLATAQAFTAANIFSANGAASTPALSLTGALFTGGTGTTTTPQALFTDSSYTVTNWSTSGTILGFAYTGAFGGEYLRANNAAGSILWFIDGNGFGSRSMGAADSSYFGLGIRLSSGLAFNWFPGAVNGIPDTGLVRSGIGTLKVTNGSTGYGAVDASAYSASGTAGIDFSGAVTNITVVKGIVTAAS